MNRQKNTLTCPHFNSFLGGVFSFIPSRSIYKELPKSELPQEGEEPLIDPKNNTMQGETGFYGLYKKEKAALKSSEEEKAEEKREQLRIEIENKKRMAMYAAHTRLTGERNNNSPSDVADALTVFREQMEEIEEEKSRTQELTTEEDTAKDTEDKKSLMPEIVTKFFEGDEELKEKIVEQVSDAMYMISPEEWREFIEKRLVNFSHYKLWNEELVNFIRPHLEEKALAEFNPNDPEAQKVWIAAIQIFLDDEGLTIDGKLGPNTRDLLTEWNTVHEATAKEEMDRFFEGDEEKMKEYLAFTESMMDRIKAGGTSGGTILRDFLGSNPTKANGNREWAEFLMNYASEEEYENKFDIRLPEVQKKLVASLQIYLKKTISGEFDSDTEEALKEWHNQNFDIVLVVVKQEEGKSLQELYHGNEEAIKEATERMEIIMKEAEKEEWLTFLKTDTAELIDYQEGNKQWAVFMKKQIQKKQGTWELNEDYLDESDLGVQEIWVTSLQDYLKKNTETGVRMTGKFDTKTKKTLVEWYNNKFDDSLLYDEENDVMVPTEANKKFRLSLDKIKKAIEKDFEIDEALFAKKINLILEKGGKFDQNNPIDWFKAMEKAEFSEEEMKKLGLNEAKEYAMRLTVFNKAYFDFLRNLIGEEAVEKINPTGTIAQKMPDIMYSAPPTIAIKPDLSTWTVGDWYMVMKYAEMSDEEISKAGLTPELLEETFGPEKITLNDLKRWYEEGKKAMEKGRAEREETAQKIGKTAIINFRNKEKERIKERNDDKRSEAMEDLIKAKENPNMWFNSLRTMIGPRQVLDEYIRAYKDFKKTEWTHTGKKSAEKEKDEKYARLKAVTNAYFDKLEATSKKAANDYEYFLISNLMDYDLPEGLNAEGLVDESSVEENDVIIKLASNLQSPLAYGPNESRAVDGKLIHIDRLFLEYTKLGSELPKSKIDTWEDLLPLMKGEDDAERKENAKAFWERAGRKEGINSQILIKNTLSFAEKHQELLNRILKERAKQQRKIKFMSAEQLLAE